MSRFLTAKNVEAALGKSVSLRKGVYTLKQSYYWGVNKSGEHLWEFVKSKIPNAKLEAYGNHQHAFVGAAKSGSKQDSYFWVKFTVSA